MTSCMSDKGSQYRRFEDAKFRAKENPLQNVAERIVARGLLTGILNDD